MSESELVQFAKTHYAKVYGFITKNFDKEKGKTLMNGTIFTCIAVDGKLSTSESRFVRQFVGNYTDNEVLSIAGDFTAQQAKDVAQKLCGLFPDDIKESYISLCVAVLAVDKRFDSAEMAFINTL